jgi:threonine/homoserine/homoserine lactone efflux protein
MCRREALLPGSSQLAGASAAIPGILVIGDALWAFLAGKVRPLLQRYGPVTNRLSGTGLFLAGFKAAATRRQA